MQPSLSRHKAFDRRDGVAALRSVARTAWHHVARVLTEILAHWNRQPFDRFWPPHP
jgi:hypothetical protein